MVHKSISPFLALLACGFAIPASAQDAKGTGKTFIDYFKPTPIVGELSKDVWGAAAVGPRDPKNGLEDSSMKQFNYWDGSIIKGPDGKYHLFGSRWNQWSGFNNWWSSKAVHAVSDNLVGPYVDKGLCWPDNAGGLGHNVTALVMKDGRYAIVVSETRPGDVFVADSVDGPWKHLGKIEVADNEFKDMGAMSNVAMMLRPDGDYQIIARSGAIWISKNGILGPYVIQGKSIYYQPGVDQPGDAGIDLKDLEDPVIWHSGGLYHVIVNGWSNRKAFHLTSVDGINDWKYRGLAYDPTTDFVRYTDGTVNHWNKLERSGVVLENGHVVAVTLAGIDIGKDDIKGNTPNGSKIIVVPFDGEALDRDLQQTSKPAP